MKISSFSYHSATSYQRGAIPSHFLDWAHQPAGFKRYPGIMPIPLERTIENGKANMQQLVEGQYGQRRITEIDLKILSSILLLTCTITDKAEHSRIPFYFRSVASAGALYPTEIYVHINGVKGLEDGLYHYALDTLGLHPLRRDPRPSGVASVSFFLSSIYFRSAWKYRDRAYRYCLLDTGHLLESLLLSLRAHDLTHNFSYDFDDNVVNDFLAIDPKREVCLVYCVLGKRSAQPSVAYIANKDKEVLREASQVSEKEVIYEAIDRIHSAGVEVRCKGPGEINMDRFLGLESILRLPIPPLSSWPEQRSYKEAVFFRRSRRNFIAKPLSRSSFHALLRAIISESRSGHSYYPVSVGFVVGNVEGYEPGIYLLSRPQAQLHLVKKGNFVQNMASICLDQAWLARSAVHVVFLTNLRIIDDTWGPRGYRYAMMESGRLGQLIYLLSTSLGLGCCGIGAFYDSEAEQLLGLNSFSRMLYLVATGPIKGGIGR